MSFIGVMTDAVSAAARTLEGIGSELGAAGSAAWAPTTGIAAAAQDEVSTAVAGLFGDFGEEFQALSAEAQAFHERFVGGLNAAMGQYLSTEAANAQQAVLHAMNSTPQELLGRSLTGIDAELRGATAASPLGPIVSAGTGILDPQFSFPVWSYQTPLGSIVLTMHGDTPLLGLGAPNVTGGSLAASPPLALALDALGPEVNASAAFGNSNAAFAHAVQTGNPVAAVTAILEAPGNVMNGFFYGETTVNGAVPMPSSTGYVSTHYRIPFGGLLAPLRPVVFTLIASDGTPTTFALSGAEFGGVVAALRGML